MRRIVVATLCCTAAWSAASMLACTGTSNDPTTPVGAGTRSVTATIDGEAFVASQGVQGVRTATTLTVTGIGSNVRQVILTLVDISAPGMVALGGANASAAQFSQGIATWRTVDVGGSGVVTVTALTANRAAGTFAFTAAPFMETGASGARTVTNGAFDIRF